MSHLNSTRQLFCAFLGLWLHAAPNDSLFDISGSDTHKGWQDWQLRENAGRRGLCVFNERWCCQYSIEKNICNGNFEPLAIGLWPFDRPWKFDCILLFTVCVPPSGEILYIKLLMKGWTVFAKHNSNSVTLLPLFNEISTTWKPAEALPVFFFYQVVKSGVLDKCHVYQSKNKPVVNSYHPNSSVFDKTEKQQTTGKRMSERGFVCFPLLPLVFFRM